MKPQKQKQQSVIKKMSVNFLGLRFDAEELPLSGLYALLVVIVLLALLYLLVAKSISPALPSLDFFRLAGLGGISSLPGKAD